MIHLYTTCEGYPQVKSLILKDCHIGYITVNFDFRLLPYTFFRLYNGSTVGDRLN